MDPKARTTAMAAAAQVRWRRLYSEQPQVPLALAVTALTRAHWLFEMSGFDDLRVQTGALLKKVELAARHAHSHRDERVARNVIPEKENAMNVDEMGVLEQGRAVKKKAAKKKVVKKGAKGKGGAG